MSDHKQKESIKAMSHKALMDVITHGAQTGCKAGCKMMEMWQASFFSFSVLFLASNLVEPWLDHACLKIVIILVIQSEKPPLDADTEAIFPLICAPAAS